MSDYKIRLNGSNQISKDREQAFLRALNEEYSIECADSQNADLADNGKIPLTTKDDTIETKGESKPFSESGISQVEIATPNLQSYIELGLNHSFDHQTRTMEIHQQYLEQQNEYIQLISSVLHQQGIVLESNYGADTKAIIDSLQQGLDNFHKIREKGMEVHQQFLNQQADYSQRYVGILEKQNGMIQSGDRYVESPTQVISQTHAEPIQTVPGPSVSNDEVKEEKIQEPQTVTTDQSKSTNLVIDQKISPEILSSALLKIVGDKTGYPPEMLELDMDLEADLGIDSIKRVEILGALEDEFPTLPPADTEILSQTRTLSEIVEYMNAEAGKVTLSPSLVEETPSPELASTNEQIPELPEKDNEDSKTINHDLSLDELTKILLQIVAEKTGYPVEMLESGMDMEADLGIDSIKRVEILGAMEDQVPGLPSVEAEALSELRTLGQIVEIMGNHQEIGNSPPIKEDVVKKKVDSPPLEKTPVQLIPLPQPDYLDININQDHPLLVTDDGSELTTRFTDTLIKAGWSVILWSFHDSLVQVKRESNPSDLIHIHQDTPEVESIEKQLNEIRSQYGSIGGFIHLHPQKNGKKIFPRSEREIIKSVFFLASELKNDLNSTQFKTRPQFFTVTRIDGRLGLEDHQNFQESSGLSGLVKTLHWEWPNVFCRAVDLSPKLEQAKQIDLIIKEMHDPNRELVEVGLGLQDRVTISREF